MVEVENEETDCSVLEELGVVYKIPVAKFEDAFFEKPQEVHRNIIEFVKSS